MPSPETLAPSDRWLRAVGYGFLAETATIVTIIAIAVPYRYAFARGLPDSAYAAFNDRVGAAVGIVGGAIYTLLLARRLMHYISRRYVAHGVVAALAAIALSVGGSIAGHHGVPTAYMVASSLKIIAGALAGYLASRKVPARAA